MTEDLWLEQGLLSIIKILYAVLRKKTRFGELRDKPFHQA